MCLRPEYLKIDKIKEYTLKMSEGTSSIKSKITLTRWSTVKHSSSTMKGNKHTHIPLLNVPFIPSKFETTFTTYSYTLLRAASVARLKNALLLNFRSFHKVLFYAQDEEKCIVHWHSNEYPNQGEEHNC
ncbi:hypothetical protein AVEN_133155-1 [Araneus ventricosus]|uniref:Uncharacterized protein n=1 Tax=Araneus ventricosus TaxID=182803 RepID=A0A4Y2W4K5_ARAVE|nr:hypothetical protein AVEN_133155-1 [Araneus ventricosus]